MANADVPNDYFDFAVAKLAGDTGVERWRFTLPEGVYQCLSRSPSLLAATSLPAVSRNRVPTRP
jgi:hypothetical protein